MQFPRWNPGIQRTPPTASQLNRLSDAAQRADGAFGEAGGTGLVDLAGGRVVTAGPEREIWIEITGGGTLVGDVATYDWRMALRDDTSIIELETQKSGTEAEFPAMEMNGNITVTTGTIVRARVGESNGVPGMEFTTPMGNGNTGGGGGVIPTFSGARVKNTADQTIGSLPAYLTFDSEDFDVGGYHSTSSNTSRLTVPTTGYYQIGYNVALEFDEAPALAWVVIYKNRTTSLHNEYVYTDTFPSPAGGTDLIIGTASTIALLSAGDYVEILVNGYDTDAIIGSYGDTSFPSPIFWITRIGE